ncbi:hypothetical protein QEN71_42970 (plasmid) [Paraburkholderia sabiae]|nr:hypothetical protein [Paraburkholderia sabiae]WJZ79926.1 hypothetical protein QEN71_42970 [Paraburkholderia sabiae]
MRFGLPPDRTLSPLRGSITPILRWLQYADHRVARLRRSCTGSIAAIIRWLDYADPGMARICRSVTPGGRSAFVGQMNLKARGLTMSDTHFEDPTGLSPDNVSTARDVVKLAIEASHYPTISSFTTLTAYEQTIGNRTRFYRNTDPVVRWTDWDVQLAKTGYTREAGRCIVVDVAMPRGPVIIALLGARSSGARSADLAMIRNWVNGGGPSVAVPRLHYASTHLHHSHPVVASQPHRVKVRFASTGPSHRMRRTA